MKKQQADKPIDEELLMRMMAGETEKPQGNGDAPETEETGQEAEEPEQETENRETAVPMENRVAGKVTDGKVPDGKTADGKRRKAKQTADYDTTFLKGMDIPARYGKPCTCGVSTTNGSPKSHDADRRQGVAIRLHRQRAAQHFEQYREEIEAAYAGKMEKLF